MPCVMSGRSTWTTRTEVRGSGARVRVRCPRCTGADAVTRRARAVSRCTVRGARCAVSPVQGTVRGDPVRCGGAGAVQSAVPPVCGDPARGARVRCGCPGARVRWRGAGAASRCTGAVARCRCGVPVHGAVARWVVGCWSLVVGARAAGPGGSGRGAGQVRRAQHPGGAGSGREA